MVYRCLFHFVVRRRGTIAILQNRLQVKGEMFKRWANDYEMRYCKLTHRYVND